MDSRNTRNRPESGGGNAPERSRFAYHGGEDEEPLEGGVRSVDSGGGEGPKDGAGAPGAPRGTGRSGAPGPEERLLDITEIVRHVGMRYRHVFRIPPFTLGDMVAATPVEGEITLTNSGAALLVRGRAKTDLRLECARCLTPLDQPVEAQIDEAFDLVTTHDAFQQDEVRAVDDDAPASVIAGNVLDLGDLLRQNLLLAAPVQPLCREDCPGIDLGGREDVAFARVPEEAGEELPDNPLRHLAEMLEEKRRREENGGS